MELREISHSSPEYAVACALRNEVLRRPLGLMLDPQVLALEDTDRHFGMWRGTHLLACLVVTPLGNRTVKLRQMCVDPAFQRQGIGRSLVQDVESILAAEGVERIELAARRVVEDFYAALGYQPVGNPFIEVTIPHVKMVKEIASRTP